MLVMICFQLVYLGIDPGHYIEHAFIRLVA